MEKIFHHVEKSWIRRIGNIFQSVGDLMIRIWSWVSQLESCRAYFKKCVHIHLWTAVLQRHYTFRYRFKMKHFLWGSRSLLDT
jgi:hypothetical protein